MDKVLSILEAQDHFYSSFQLYFNKKLRIHSAYSTGFSIIINLICIAMFISLLIELSTRSKPTVTFAKINAPVTTNMTLNSDLLYTIGIRDQFLNDLNDPSIVILEPHYTRIRGDSGKLTEEHTLMDFINCTQYYARFNELGLGSVFNSTGLKNYNCYNGTTFSEPIVIGGKYGSSFYGNLRFNIKKCINGTSNVICKSEEEINDALQNSWLQVSYLSSYVDFNNYSNPIQYVTEEFYTNIDTHLTKISYQYFNPVFIYSENNIIFSNQKVESASKEERQTFDTISPTDDGLIYRLYICPSYTVEKYFRRYMKIQELGASVGGFWSGISVVWFLLLTKIQLRDLQMKVVNAIFDCRSTKLINPKASVFVRFTPTEGSTISVMKVSTLTQQKQYQVNFGLYNTLRMYLCPCSAEAKQMNNEYKQVFNEAMNYCDFTEIFHGFQDIEKLKLMVSNKPSNLQRPPPVITDITLDWLKEKKVIEIGNDNNLNNISTLNYKTYLTTTGNCDSKYFFRTNENRLSSAIKNQAKSNNQMYFNAQHVKTNTHPKNTSN